MDISKDLSLLRIFVSSTDIIDHKPLYEVVTVKAKEEGLAGATVLRGVMGFGASSKIHSSKFWELTEKLPTVIELVDETEKIKTFYKSIKPLLESVPKGIMVTIEKTEVLMNKSGKKGRY
jgi:PII-like signaling protein